MRFIFAVLMIPIDVVKYWIIPALTTVYDYVHDWALDIYEWVEDRLPTKQAVRQTLRATWSVVITRPLSATKRGVLGMVERIKDLARWCAINTFLSAMVTVMVSWALSLLHPIGGIGVVTGLLVMAFVFRRDLTQYESENVNVSVLKRELNKLKSEKKLTSKRYIDGVWEGIELSRQSVQCLRQPTKIIFVGRKGAKELTPSGVKDSNLALLGSSSSRIGVGVSEYPPAEYGG